MIIHCNVMAFEVAIKCFEFGVDWVNPSCIRDVMRVCILWYTLTLIAVLSCKRILCLLSCKRKVTIFFAHTWQGRLYTTLIEKVDGFRGFIGAPDIERFNLVLLGGKLHAWCMRHDIYLLLYHHAGLLGSLFSLLQFLASPLIGTMSDIYGRKPTLLVSMVSLWHYTKCTHLLYGTGHCAHVVTGVQCSHYKIYNTVRMFVRCCLATKSLHLNNTFWNRCRW